MPRKGMRSLCFHSKTSSFALASSRASVSGPPRTSSESELVMARAIEAAEQLIMKWNPDTSTYARVTSLFYEDKQEAGQFVKCVNDLQQAMHALASDNSTSDMLVRAQGLMEVAMKRLQKELYQILSLNRAHLDPESVSTRSSRTSTSTTTRSSTSDDYDDEGEDDSDARVAKGSISEVEEASLIAMADLRSIADCMISSGYAKECIGIYKVIRKSIIDEGIYRLGVEKVTASQVQKMPWEAVEAKIKSWLEAVKVLVGILFYGERILCDHVFAASDSIRQSCFGEITKEGAALLFGFPEAVARSSKKSPEKMFRLLDMYMAISENWHDIETVFAFDSTSTVLSLAVNSLVRLGESVRSSLADFESTILKDSSKSAVPGGGVHSLTVDTMNYLCLLSDYSNILGDIFVDEQPNSPSRSPLPESYFDSPDRDDTHAPAISIRLAWLVLVLLCKLDARAKHYKDVSVSYLFLANNLQHVVSRVRTSNLKYLLGDDWIVKHEDKVRQFAGNYERIGWGKVFDSLLTNTNSMASSLVEALMRFNSSFEDAYQRQSSTVVPDQVLRDMIKASIEQKIVPAYREFYDSHKATFERERASRSIFKYAPEDIKNRLSGLFVMSNCRTSLSSSFSSRLHLRSR
ncbi:exocyst complex component EXO70H1-like [Punica granatum]|uniref:Exocyst subunit Exo70 family protein n=2 Tax=Punica granatum TaxID=22663 RepID=A0A2I0JZV0_PUNGR|nr:exocyst complex component EXO70H1-like [Punica granatum]PKI60986.1 hypothetical protein CRG98_018616 [Punica granatum]